MTSNTPDLWLPSFPKPTAGGHKYDRGHALIYGAPELTGATRLAAEACARMGAGLTTVLASKETADIYRTALPAHIMVRADLNWWDERVTSVLYGPGGLPCPVNARQNIAGVLDADALGTLPEKLHQNIVLTPHEGEFRKIFPEITGSREDQALQAAAKTRAVVVLKGPDTLIAHPDGRFVRNTHTSPYLANAGTGDVLAGMITGLLAQGMPAFEAACAAVWVHGEIGRQIGPGLVASDISPKIPETLRYSFDFGCNHTEG